MASRPKDESHPYGHKKYETFTSIFIAVLLFLISINLLKVVVTRFFNPVVPNITPVSFAVMVATLLINSGVVVYEYKRGRALGSDILVSDSMHTKTDIYASLSVIVAFIAIKAGFVVFDLLAGIFISVLIALCGIKILKESSYVLCDGSAVEQQRIMDVVKAIEGVKQCHKIRTRGRQDDVHVDLHVSVDTNMHVDKAHFISHRIQNEVKEKIKGVTDVIVHIEPIKKIHAKKLER
jgi:cation diffusion facilitator family transporter